MNKLLRWLFSIGLLMLLAVRLNWDQIQSSFLQIRMNWAVGALGLFITCALLAAYRWRLLSQPLGFDQSLGRFTSLYFLGMYFNLLLPTSVGGDVVRVWYLSAGQPRKMQAFVCVFVDRLTGLLVLIGMACIATIWMQEQLPNAMIYPVWFVAGCTSLGLALLPMVSRWLEQVHTNSTDETEPGKWQRRWQRLAAVPANVIHAFAQYRGQTLLILSAFSLTSIIMISNVIVVWMLAQAIGANVPLAAFWVAVPVVTLLTLVPISINGIGVREAGMGLILGSFGASETMGATIGVLLFAVHLVTGLIGGVIYLFGDFRTEQAAVILPFHPQPRSEVVLRKAG